MKIKYSPTRNGHIVRCTGCNQKLNLKKKRYYCLVCALNEREYTLVPATLRLIDQRNAT